MGACTTQANSLPALQVELASLWKHCFPAEPWYCGPSDRWKDAGFQGSNPAHDFRGGGIFSLRNLIYMAKHHKHTFHRLLWKETGERSDFEYPFCAAGTPCSPPHLCTQLPAELLAAPPALCTQLPACPSDSTVASEIRFV